MIATDAATSPNAPKSRLASPRILIAHLSIGGGHSRAAEAAARALRKLMPRAEVAELDLQQVASPLFNAIYKSSYLGIVKSIPHLWGALYQAGWRTQRGSAMPAWLRPRCVGRLAACLAQLDPQVILATAAPVSALISHLKSSGATQGKLAALLTDYQAHPTHVQPGVERFLVAGNRVAAGLRMLGVKSDRIRVTGIPIDEEFGRPADQQKARRMLGLDPALPVALVMSGALGTGHVRATIEALLTIDRPLQILAVAGRNRRLEARLHELKRRRDCRLEVFGFTSMVPDLMSAADLMITKPGGMSTTEALARGLPMVFVDAIHGQESRNQEFFVRGGCAVAVGERSDLPPLVEHLLAAPDKLRAMREKATRLARPRAAIDVAQSVLELAEG